MLYPVLQDPLHQIVSSLFDRPRGASIGQMLFGAGEQGAWYDVADMSTLFQDAAGATPVTAVEQQVGRMLDKSGRGNHATQVTATKRPVFSRRYNTWLRTEDPASFGTLNASLTAAPAGPLHFELADDTATGVHKAHIGYLSFGENKTFTCSFLAKPLASSRYLYANVAGGAPAAVFDLLNGVVVLQGGGGTEDLSSEISLDASTGICACKMRFTQKLTFTNSAWRFGLTTTGVNEQSYAGGGTQRVALGSISITGGAFDIPYQRVTTATDYDADPGKFPAYLLFDGIDDGATSPTGGGGTAGFFYSSAITVAGGAGTARTLFSDAGANTGYIVRINASNQLELAAGNGTAYTTVASAAAMTAPTSAVVQAWDDGINLNVRIGSGPVASVARPAVSAGTADFTVGQDNGASSGYFNGRICSTIYRKDSAPTLAQRDAVAAYQRLQARFA